MDEQMDERTGGLFSALSESHRMLLPFFTQINFLFAKLATSHENKTKLLFLQVCFLSTESDPFSVTVTVIIYLWCCRFSFATNRRESESRLRSSPTACSMRRIFQSRGKHFPARFKNYVVEFSGEQTLLEKEIQ